MCVAQPPVYQAALTDPYRFIVEDPHLRCDHTLQVGGKKLRCKLHRMHSGAHDMAEVKE